MLTSDDPDKFKSMEEKHSFSVLPFLKSIKNQNGMSAVFLRITVDGIRTELSTKIQIEKTQWLPTKGRIKGSNEDVRRLNNRIKGLEDRIHDIHDELVKKGKLVSGGEIKGILEGAEVKKHGLLNYFNLFVTEMKSLIGNGYAEGTVKNWKVTQGHLKEFIKKEYKRDDYMLAELNLDFAVRFEIYAKTFWKCKNNAVIKHLERIRKVIKRQITRGIIDKDPFYGYECPRSKPKPKFLRLDELQAIEKKTFQTERLEQIKDVFLFSCYTGLAYADINNLTAEHIGIGIDNKEWIFTSRIKTNNDSNVPLLSQAKAILEKYKDNPLLIEKGKLLPVSSNIKTNEYLKEIADLCSIKKNLTFHMARHTFATTVTLTNGVPLETVSKMLGHKKITTTQIYAQVIETKVSADMAALESKLALQKT